MNSFAYTAKASDGALKRGVLSAADRTAALEALRRQGLMPVTVEETSAVSAGHRAVPMRTLTYAAIALILIVGGVWLVLSRRNEQPPVKPSGAAPAERRTSPRAAVATTDRPTASAPVQPLPKQSNPSGTSGRSNRSESLPSPAISAKIPTPRAAPVANDVPIEETPQEPPRPRAFKTATEQLLAMAFSVPPGKSMPPLPVPPDIDDDFVVSLTNQVVVFDDDDEKMIALKEEVAYAKLDLLEMIKEGRSVADVLKEYEQDNNERAAIRSEAETQLRTMIKNGKRKEAEEYLRSINEAFREYGIEPIAMPRASKSTSTAHQ